MLKHVSSSAVTGANPCMLRTNDSKCLNNNALHDREFGKNDPPNIAQLYIILTTIGGITSNMLCVYLYIKA